MQIFFKYSRVHKVHFEFAQLNFGAWKFSELRRRRRNFQNSLAIKLGLICLNIVCKSGLFTTPSRGRRSWMK